MNSRFEGTVSGGSAPAQVRRYAAGRVQGPAKMDFLARETPVAFEYNGVSHATLLASPCDLEDLALGFSLTEGILRSASDLHDLDIVEAPQGLIARMTISSACFARLKARRRSLAGRTGCGLCGLETLEDVVRPLPPVRAPRQPIAPAALIAATTRLRDMQPLHRETGSTHAAAWASLAGDILQVREDVGRHNALDKLIGVLMHRRQPADVSAGFVVISSRASFEIVQKAAAAGIAALIAVSAPTHHAVTLADELGLMLAGFARGDGFTVYAHPEHLA